ncbi:FIT family protein CG10671 [Rhopalosiphum maidis]|uniref:FIT family protein CG10671 n=1 Tax=Rhopalosiphum maidis TaxID=43146 RepID=UPI000EFE9251|nr:FIT family protein CG10671 [Rhopalosiphum maidis]
MTTKRSTRSGSIESNYIPTGLAMRSETKGTLLVREPTTVSSIFLTVLLFACRKYLFLSTHKRLFVYLVLLVASVVGDFIKFPKIYFANSDTFLNQYLVKLGWFWTLLWTLSFLITTSKVFCLNTRSSITVHASRLVIATFFWYFWTNAFNRLEDYYGKCSGGKGLGRSSCKSAGHQWRSFDISGHVFILIYSTLVMISEARPIIGWDKIQDVLRNEENARKEGKSVATTFSNLKEDELQEMKTVYKQMTPFVQILFLVITIFVAVWELMLITTMMYFHTMPEKLLAGIVAMSTWFVTYRAWYSSSFLPPLPGDGFFKNQALQKSEIGI